MAVGAHCYKIKCIILDPVYDLLSRVTVGDLYLSNDSLGCEFSRTFSRYALSLVTSGLTASDP